jgi:hypothetical protein
MKMRHFAVASTFSWTGHLVERNIGRDSLRSSSRTPDVDLFLALSGICNDANRVRLHFAWSIGVSQMGSFIPHTLFKPQERENLLVFVSYSTGDSRAVDFQ